jgi:hypothetical protein
LAVLRRILVTATNGVIEGTAFAVCSVAALWLGPQLPVGVEVPVVVLAAPVVVATASLSLLAIRRLRRSPAEATIVAAPSLPT